LHSYRPRRDEYLRALLRRDGCLNADSEVCRACKDKSTANFCCEECFGDDMLCASCIVDRHAENPLHWIEEWDGICFARTSLAKLGLRIQLGHRMCERCSGTHVAHTEFVVLHINGIHVCNVDICDCEDAEQAGPPEIQMLRAGWFPATDDKPRTCATFAMLDHFQMATLQSKTTMYDYYAALEKLTNNTGVKPPNRYHVFLGMCRKWGDLLMLKRAGRGHAEGGVAETKVRELAVLCPCCPRPGENLSEDWMNAPPEMQCVPYYPRKLGAC
ncbi:hypothetical protein FB451DRAFT_1042950, partial [Mycena latifolia]